MNQVKRYRVVEGGHALSRAQSSKVRLAEVLAGSDTKGQGKQITIPNDMLFWSAEIDSIAKEGFENESHFRKRLVELVLQRFGYVGCDDPEGLNGCPVREQLLSMLECMPEFNDFLSKYLVAGLPSR
jgi:hypothetical protein